MLSSLSDEMQYFDTNICQWFMKRGHVDKQKDVCVNRMLSVSEVQYFSLLIPWGYWSILYVSKQVELYQVFDIQRKLEGNSQVTYDLHFLSDSAFLIFVFHRPNSRALCQRTNVLVSGWVCSAWKCQKDPGQILCPITNSL